MKKIQNRNEENYQTNMPTMSNIMNIYQTGRKRGTHRRLNKIPMNIFQKKRKIIYKYTEKNQFKRHEYKKKKEKEENCIQTGIFNSKHENWWESEWKEETNKKQT